MQPSSSRPPVVDDEDVAVRELAMFREAGGGTVVDVTEWGHSAKDLQDAVVIVRDGRITDVGSRYAITIPKGARVLDCTGKYLIPGLVDGFAGMNSQGQASVQTRRLKIRQS